MSFVVAGALTMAVCALAVDEAVHPMVRVAGVCGLSAVAVAILIIKPI